MDRFRSPTAVVVQPTYKHMKNEAYIIAPECGLQGRASAIDRAEEAEQLEPEKKLVS